MADLYLRPAGLVSLSRAGFDAESEPAPLRLAGGWRSFSVVELVHRDGARQLRPLPVSDADIASTLERLTAPRPAVAWLSLERPCIMGIVNVTPDSFSDGGRYATTEAAIAHGLRLAEAGADILDIGGESTRPGSDPVPLGQELARVMPVIEGLKGRTKARLSVDTRKAGVMRRAAAAGVDMLNDVSALSHDPEAIAVAAETGLPVILMHARGDPKTMQQDPRYDDVVLDVYDYLAGRIAAAEEAGIPPSRLIVDPGIGFGKTLAHNLALLKDIALFHGLGVPILLGASRKRFIGTLTGETSYERRVPGSVAAALYAVSQGVQIVRVHDVAEMAQALAVWEAISGAREP